MAIDARNRRQRGVDSLLDGSGLALRTWIGVRGPERFCTKPSDGDRAGAATPALASSARPPDSEAAVAAPNAAPPAEKTIYWALFDGTRSPRARRGPDRPTRSTVSLAMNRRTTPAEAGDLGICRNAVDRDGFSDDGRCCIAGAQWPHGARPGRTRQQAEGRVARTEVLHPVRVDDRSGPGEAFMGARPTGTAGRLALAMSSGWGSCSRSTGRSTSCARSSLRGNSRVPTSRRQP